MRQMASRMNASNSRSCISTHLAEKAGLPTNRFPKGEEETARAEEVLEVAFAELSIDEHEKIIFDIHGLSSSPEEDASRLESALKDLEASISKIAQKEAYEHALFQNRQYVMNKDFRTMFLSALKFDVAGAAQMIVDHFEKKRELFGDEVLGRDIWQSDLHPHVLEFLNEGYLQLLPSRDTAGRFVLAYRVDTPPRKADALCFKQSCFYNYMAILREMDFNKAGSVYICYGINPDGLDLNIFEAIYDVEAVIPLRGSGGHHCCLDTPGLRAMVAGVNLFFDNHDRFRYRSHFGTLEENRFILQTYGIPTSDSPMQIDGTWSVDYHCKWLEKVRLDEEHHKQQAETSDVIMIPRREDVLCGKSQRAKNSSGTLRALHLVDKYRDTYESKSKHEKTVVAKEILSLIHKSGGRFLKENKERGGWEELDELAARQKISHWFRHLRAKTTNRVVSRRVSDLSEDNSEKSARVKAREEVVESILPADDLDSPDPAKRPGTLSSAECHVSIDIETRHSFDLLGADESNWAVRIEEEGDENDAHSWAAI